MNQAFQLGDPKGRLDLLVVRLVECAIKARMGIPSDGTLVVDFLHVGETLSRRSGYREFASLRPRLEQLAGEYGVSTVQTLPELAHTIGLLRGPRARGKRRPSCMR